MSCYRCRQTPRHVIFEATLSFSLRFQSAAAADDDFQPPPPLR
jgi:hypothetical protein